MAKFTLELEDNEESKGVNINFDFDPKIDDDSEEELTNAQTIAAYLLQKLDKLQKGDVE